MRSKQVVLTDTCAVIMLLRIAPDMFQSPEYCCVMSYHIYDEFIKKKEFLEKYPWRPLFSKYLKSAIQLGDLKRDKGYYGVVNVVKQYQRNYGLSNKDCEIVAIALYKNFDFCSGDENLFTFAKNEFDLNTLSVLELVNDWIEGGLIIWNSQRHAVLNDWIKMKERCQPRKQIERFERLTNWKYPQ